MQLQSSFYRILLTSICLFLVILQSCRAEVTSFKLYVHDNVIDSRPRLRDIGRRSVEQEATVLPGEDAFIYGFQPAVDIDRDDIAFIIHYTSADTHAKLQLLQDDSIIADLQLAPHKEERIIQRHLLSPGMRITGFQITVGEFPLQIHEIAFAAQGRPIFSYASSDAIHASEGWYFEQSEESLFITLPQNKEAVMRYADVAANETAVPTKDIMLSLHYHADTAQTVTVELDMSGGEVGKQLAVREGSHAVYFHTADIPEFIRLPQASFTDFTLELIYVPEFPHAIPADLGTIHQPPLWRQEDYELFSWSLYPDILVLHSSTLAIQAQFFKRLAFFVEKRDYRGSILSNNALQGKHGWNAHNYRAEDLASFFSNVDVNMLNFEELLLRDILLEHGTIIAGDNAYIAGQGGILGISADISSGLRKKLLLHESLHGIFYEEERYRDSVLELWHFHLSDEDRDFWRFMLATLSYDDQDEYLMVNEFQSYLLQQDPTQIISYFNHQMRSRLYKYSNRHNYINNYINNNVDFLRENALFLLQRLRIIRNLDPSNLFCLF